MCTFILMRWVCTPHSYRSKQMCTVMLEALVYTCKRNICMQHSLPAFIHLGQTGSLTWKVQILLQPNPVPTLKGRSDFTLADKQAQRNYEFFQKTSSVFIIWKTNIQKYWTAPPSSYYVKKREFWVHLHSLITNMCVIRCQIDRVACLS